MTPIVLHDLRSAFRLLRGRAAFGWSVVITVAAASGFLGIAANLAAALLFPFAGGSGRSSFAVLSAALFGGAVGDDEALAAMRPIAVVLLLAGAMVLAAACASLATLSMSHYRTRLSEFAIRASIGGTPRRLVRQLHTEGLVLSLAACALGGVFAFWTRQLMFSWLSPEQAAIVEDSMSAGATIAASAVSLSACALVFFACARTASGLGLPLLFSESDSLSSAVKGARPRRVLVVVQVAVACALLVGAAMLRSGMNHALQTGPGTTAAHVAVVSTNAPTRYGDPVRGRRFQLQALERVARLPGVRSVAATSTLPLVGASKGGYSRDPEGPFAPYETITVSSGYFATMQHGIVVGQEFDDRNDTVRATAVVINEALANLLFPTVSAVGQSLIAADGRHLEIIGIASDARFRKMADPVKPTIFLPLSSLYLSGLHFVARTDRDATTVVKAIGATLRSIDSAEIDRETTLEAHLQTAVRRDRIAMVFIAACALLILLFAISGPYLLTRHAVTSRYDELAVRLAFGARGGHIFGLVLGQAARATVTGVLIGETVALALAAIFAGATGDTASSTTQVAVAIGVALTTACAIAAVVPAFRAYA